MALRKITSVKGDISELPLFIVMAFFLAVAFICVGFFIDVVYDVVNDTALNDTSVSTQVKDQLSVITSETLHKSFAVFFAIGVIGMLISSFLVRIHPVFLFLYIISAGFSLFVTLFLANTYQDLTEVGALASVANQQTITNYIMQYSVTIFMAVGFLSMIVLFAKIFSKEGFRQLTQ